MIRRYCDICAGIILGSGSRETEKITLPNAFGVPKSREACRECRSLINEFIEGLEAQHSQRIESLRAEEFKVWEESCNRLDAEARNELTEQEACALASGIQDLKSGSTTPLSEVRDSLAKKKRRQLH